MFLLCFLCTLINPYGAALHQHIVGHLLNPLTYQISPEFASPDFHLFPLWYFEGLLVLGLLAGASAAGGRDFVSLLLVLTFAHLALVSVRNVPLAALVIAPIIGQQFQRVLGRARAADTVRQGCRMAARRLWHFSQGLAVTEGRLTGHWLPTAVVLLYLYGGLHGGVLWGRPWLHSEFAAHKYPVAVAQFLRSAPPTGRVFNTYGWGGILIYYLHTQVRVFIDSRADLYPPEFLQRYLTIEGLRPGWKEALQTLEIDWMVLEVGSALAAALGESREWEIIYRDTVAVVLRRASGR